MAARLRARYDPDGTTDGSFGQGGSVKLRGRGALAVGLQRMADRIPRSVGGIVRTRVEYDPAAYALAIQADGKIVAAGTDDDTDIEGTVALARYLAA